MKNDINIVNLYYFSGKSSLNIYNARNTSILNFQCKTITNSSFKATKIKRTTNTNIKFKQINIFVNHNRET